MEHPADFKLLDYCIMEQLWFMVHDVLLRPIIDLYEPHRNEDRKTISILDGCRLVTYSAETSMPLFTPTAEYQFTTIDGLLPSPDEPPTIINGQEVLPFKIFCDGEYSGVTKHAGGSWKALFEQYIKNQILSDKFCSLIETIHQQISAAAIPFLTQEKLFALLKKIRNMEKEKQLQNLNFYITKLCQLLDPIFKTQTDALLLAFANCLHDNENKNYLLTLYAERTASEDEQKTEQQIGFCRKF